METIKKYQNVIIAFVSGAILGIVGYNMYNKMQIEKAAEVVTPAIPKV